MLLAITAEESRLQYAVDTAGARSNLKKIERVPRRNLQRAGFKAPIPGIVNEVLLDVGDYVTPNQAVITLVETASLDLYIEVRIKLSG